MSAWKPFEQPFWLSRLLDNAYYVGANALTDKVWDTIFNNLSKYPEFDFGSSGIGNNDAKTYIRRRLACLLPDSNSQYGYDQISVWASLMTSPLTVSNDDLQKVVAMENLQYPFDKITSLTTSLLTVSNDDLQKVLAMDNLRSLSLSGRSATRGLRGFFVCSWAISVSGFDTLYNYLKKEEKTFHELAAWDNFIADNELGPDDRIIIRYIGSCLLSEWPIKLIANICEQTEDDRSGILAEFLPAVVSALPAVAETCQCHLIQHITTSAEDEEGFHELVHSILIEFFGASFVLNRHPDSKLSKSLTERIHIPAGLTLHFDYGALDRIFLECPPTVLSKLQVHFDNMMSFVDQNREATGTHNDVLRLDQAKRNALLDQSIPRYYKRDRAIMVIATRGMHINEYMRGRPFTLGRDPANHLIGQILSDVKDVDLRVMYAAPFAYYCMAPWPKPGCFEDAVTFMWDYFKIVKPLVWVTFGKEMAACVVRRCGYYGLYTTDAYLGEIGKPVTRQIGNHQFVHVPLLDPSRCRYGVDYVDEAAFKFMQASFWNAMLVADLVMRVLDDTEAIEAEMAVQTDSERDGSDTDSSLSVKANCGSTDTAPTESEVICRLVTRSYQKYIATNEGTAFFVALEKDFKGLDEVVEKELLFIP
ncbi:hypothetical protein F5B21DRAFT_261710 [Xylaria acuta]|nr:hypothetical protein F5B21DRAFT_261710 [Xylaria acuta]